MAFRQFGIEAPLTLAELMEMAIRRWAPPKGFGEASVPDFRGPWPLRRAIFLPIEGVELAATSRDARRGGARGEKEQLIRTDY